MLPGLPEPVKEVVPEYEIVLLEMGAVTLKLM
jgi:hypothetical protein